MRRVALGAVACGAALATVLLGAAAPASADVVDDGAPGMLTIDATPLNLDLHLDPGESGEWLLTLHLDAPSLSEVTLTIDSDGGLVEHPDGLRLTVEECDVAWTPAVAPDALASCAGARATLLPEAVFAELDPAINHLLGTLDSGQTRFLRAVVGFPDRVPSELQGEIANLALGFAVEGDSETIVTPLIGDGSGGLGSDALGSTGIMIGAPLALAAVLGSLGALLRLLDRRRTEVS